MFSKIQPDTQVKYPFLKYMSNNGGFKQTPDPVTFWGDLVASVAGRITLAGKYFCVLGGRATRWLAANHHSGKILQGSAAKKVPRA